MRLINVTISSGNSDLEGSSFTIPESNIATFNNISQSKDGVYYNNSLEYGAYYSWHTATAGTSSGITAFDASGSICPLGWRLPTCGSDVPGNDVEKLYSSYPTKELLTKKPVPNFLFSGYIFNGSLSSIGSIGDYWVASDYRNNTRAFLRNWGSPLNPGQYDYGRIGLSVRCLAK